jgi:hypothetical protein
MPGSVSATSIAAVAPTAPAPVFIATQPGQTGTTAGADHATIEAVAANAAANTSSVVATQQQAVAGTDLVQPAMAATHQAPTRPVASIQPVHGAAPALRGTAAAQTGAAVVTPPQTTGARETRIATAATVPGSGAARASVASAAPAHQASQQRAPSGEVRPQSPPSADVSDTTVTVRARRQPVTRSLDSFERSLTGNTITVTLPVKG